MLTFCRNCNGPLKTVSDDISGENISQLICSNCRTANPQDYMYCKKCAEPLSDQVADINIASTASADNIDKASMETALDQSNKTKREEETTSTSDSDKLIESIDTKQSKSQEKTSSGNYIFKAIFITGIIALIVVAIGYYNNSNNRKDVTTQPSAPSPTSKARQPDEVKAPIVPEVTTKNEEPSSAPTDTTTQNSAPNSSGEQEVSSTRQSGRENDIQEQINASEPWQPSSYCDKILKDCGGHMAQECVHLRIVDRQSTCQGNCAENLSQQIASLGYSIQNRRWWSMNGASGPAACIGYRTDIGGTYEGAMCLARILGPPYQVGSCNADGFPYTVKIQ